MCTALRVHVRCMCTECHVQVLISPEPVTRDAILGNIAAALLPGAHLLLVVPAVRLAQLMTLTLTPTATLTLTLTLTRCAQP